MSREQLDDLIIEVLSDPHTTMEELDSLAMEQGFRWQIGICFSDEEELEYEYQ